jgi:hypothetical protein
VDVATNVEFKLAMPLQPIQHLTIAEMAALPLDMHYWIQSLWTMGFTCFPEAILLHHVVGDVSGGLAVIHAVGGANHGLDVTGVIDAVGEALGGLDAILLIGGLDVIHAVGGANHWLDVIHVIHAVGDAFGGLDTILLIGGLDVFHAGVGATHLIIEPEKLEEDKDLLWTWCTRRPVTARRHAESSSAQKWSQVPATHTFAQ